MEESKVKLLDVLKSREFVTLFVSLLTFVIASLVPDLKPLQEWLTENLIYVVILLLAGYRFEDVLKAWLARPGNVEKFGAAVQGAIDYFESRTGKDINDAFEVIVVKAITDAAREYAKPEPTAPT